MTEEQKKSKVQLSNKAYDVMKRVVQVVLPASGALYFGLAGYWDLPSPEEVVGSIAVVTTFLGVVLGLSEKQYKNDDSRFDGQMVVQTDDIGDKTISLELMADPEKLINMDEIVFKVSDSPWFPEELDAQQEAEG